MARCAACGQPGHRYDTNDPPRRFDPQACINTLLGVIERRTLPGFDVCGECEGTGAVQGECSERRRGMSCTAAHYKRCPVCSGVGSVPDDATVEAAAQAIEQVGPDQDLPVYARAALVAYARLVKETR